MTQTHKANETNPSTADGAWLHIGDVAACTGLSLRTIRYYEEASLVTPSQRTTGGFRLYTESDIERLQLIKQMKPLGFTLEEMRDLLHLLDELAADTEDAGGGALEGLRRFSQEADGRCEQLRERLATATRFADMLRLRSAAARRTAPGQ